MDHEDSSSFTWTLQAEARRGWISELVWAPNGQALAIAGATGIALFAIRQGQLQLRAVLEGHAGPVKGIAVSPDGALLASAGADRSIRLWDLKRGAAVRQLSGHEGSVERVAFTLDGALLASAGADKSLRVHDVATGAGLNVIYSHEDELRALCFCESGRLLVSGGRDRRVCVHDVAGGRLLRSEQHADWLRVLLAMPGDDGRLLSASRDGDLRLRPCREGWPLQSLACGHGGLDCAAVAPDGRTLATGGRDCQIRLWRVESGTQIYALVAHERPVLTLAFSPDGRWLASGGGDNRLRLWRRAAH
ncbi:MAG: WD40 repeat domain-containing protein [Anaerolineaceae bacterium]|nr:WD40 repeat domain-containing protein [Anaerolineaceae bacterium]